MRRISDEDIEFIRDLHEDCEHNVSWAVRMFKNERGYDVNRSTVVKYWKESKLGVNGRGGDTRSEKYLDRVRMLGIEMQKYDGALY